MTQQVVQAKVILPSIHDPLDTSSFTLTLEATGSDPNLDFSTSSTPQSIVTAFLNNLAPGQINPLAFYISTDVSRVANACSIVWSDVTAHLDGSPHGSPFRTDFFTLGASDVSAPLPPQIALTIGIRGDYGSLIEHGGLVSMPSSDSAIDQGAPATHMGKERPRARVRGRIFLGPLNSNHPISGLHGNPDNTMLTDAGAAVNGLIQTHNTVSANQFNIVVWSRRDAAVNPATNYFVDEFLTTQRRRADTTAARVHNWVARH